MVQIANKLLVLLICLAFIGCASVGDNKPKIIVVQPITTETAPLSVYVKKLNELKHDIEYYHPSDTAFTMTITIVDSLMKANYIILESKIDKYSKAPRLIIISGSIYRYLKTGNILNAFFILTTGEIAHYIVKNEIIENKIVIKDDVHLLNGIIDNYNKIIIRKYYQ